METLGSNFWLYLADGGSVHFVNVSTDTSGHIFQYQASEVFDPHGLRTALSYDTSGNLTKVAQDGGRCGLTPEKWT